MPDWLSKLRLWVADGDERRVRAIHLSPDDRHLAIVQGDWLYVHRLDGEQLVQEALARRAAGLLPSVKWSASGELLAFVNADKNVELLRTRSGTSSIVPGPAHGLDFSPNGSQLAVMDERTLKIHPVDASRTARSVEIPVGTGISFPNVALREALAFSPDGQWIAGTSRTDTLLVWDAVRLEVATAPEGHQDAVLGIAWVAPDVVATSSIDRTVRIWQVPDGRELRLLEAGEFLGIAYAPAHEAVVGWTRNGFVVWSTATWDIQWRGPLPAPKKDFGMEAWPLDVSQRSTLIATIGGPAVTDIIFSRGWDAIASCGTGSVSTYANAKILLLGDSGVGKSGLALVLAGEEFRLTESTHGRRIWRMRAPELNDGQPAQREVLLWDLAGQPGYRIVHQLHLSGAAVALVLFDSRSETEPLAGVGYWARVLRHAQATCGHSGDPLPMFLVAARTDRGVVGVSDERLAEVVEEFGFRALLSTSAREGWGIDELRQAALEAIDWSRVPLVTSSVLFAAVKSFVLDQKAGGTLLTPLAALHASFLAAPVTGPAAEAAPAARAGRDLLEREPDSGEPDQARLRGVFEGCVARLESAGLVEHLAFGDLVLLQPELLDVYAGAIVNAAREEPDGLGSMLESRVLAVDFPLPKDERITDGQQERLLVIATLEELTWHEVMLREETEDGTHLVFPSAFRRDLPGAAEPSGDQVEFRFEGPVGNIYSTLVVRLSRSNRFTRCGLWQSAAQFKADAGGLCTVHLVRSDEGRGAIQVGFDSDVVPIVRAQFERFLMAHLERRATPGTIHRRRRYTCPDCGAVFSDDQVEGAQRRGRTTIVCPVDETRVPLDDPDEALRHAQDGVAREMDVSADAARGVATASSVIRGKEETGDFDVFLCHNVADKPTIRQTAQRLREHGILPWLDEAELPPGRPWQPELERQIANIRAAAVFVGPDGLGPWQSREMEAFLREFAERDCPVIPVLLPGATAPALPLFLRGMTWVNLDEEDPTAIERLVWGITGRKPEWMG